MSEHATPSDEPQDAIPPITIPAQSTVEKGGGIRWGLISSLILLAVIIVLAVQNSQMTVIRFLTWETPEISLSVVILGSAFIAVLLDELFGVFWRVRRRRRRRAATRADDSDA